MSDPLERTLRCLSAFAVIDGYAPPNGARSVYIAEEQAGYLAGAAAALATKTNVVGFVGGHQDDKTERWRAGYEAGVRALDPTIEIVAIYASTKFRGTESVALGSRAVEALFERNADVVLAVAGSATLGVIETASELSAETSTRRWVIGSNADWSVGIGEHLTPFVLTSALRKWDVAIFETIKAYTTDDFDAGVTVLSMAEEAVALAPSEYLTDDAMTRIAELSTGISTGATSVPLAPVGELLPPPGIEVLETVTVTWDGENCSYSGPTTAFELFTPIRVEFVNLTSEYQRFSGYHDAASDFGTELSTLVQPMATNTGYLSLSQGRYFLNCEVDVRADDPYERYVAATLTVQSP